ncbi:MAG TPA: homoserine dehydrogenase [Aggregatilineales bacterium]|nr:homoserine dehydrogenase [Aggregatilineales bacterium]
MLRLAIIGFGTVGGGFTEILAARPDLDMRLVAVSDLMKGAVYHPDGLDLSELLNSSRDLAAYPDGPALVRGLDSLGTIKNSNADVIIETSYTDLNTGEPAISHVRAAFEAGKHAIATNKGPVALAYRDLADLAKRRGVYFGYEGTVMSGTPSLRLARVALAGCTIRAARGILNGTTNYILTQMESGAAYAEALAEAQKAGYAEADPTGDVEGFDAAGKLVILANTIFGAALRMQDVDRTGITQLTPADIEVARQAGQRWKLIAEVARTGNTVAASVKPTCLPLADPLAGVGGVTNAITYETDLLGPVTLIGPGAGRTQTGFAILSDLLELKREFGK